MTIMDILNKICKDQGIIVKGFSEEIARDICKSLTKGDTRGKAYAIRVTDEGQDINAILYDDTAPMQMQRSQLAHEVGHIMLGHLYEHCPLSSEQCETEAMIFDAVFIALMLFAQYGGFNNRS